MFLVLQPAPCSLSLGFRHGRLSGPTLSAWSRLAGFGLRPSDVPSQSVPLAASREGHLQGSSERVTLQLDKPSTAPSPRRRGLSPSAWNRGLPDRQTSRLLTVHSGTSQCVHGEPPVRPLPECSLGRESASRPEGQHLLRHCAQSLVGQQPAHGLLLTRESRCPRGSQLKG